MKQNKMKMTLKYHLVILTIAVFAPSASKYDLVVEANAGSNAFKSPCGTEKQVAAKVSHCLTQILDIAEGRIEKPANDADLVAIAEKFATSEKCIRGVARECLTGLHKTTTSSVAGASRRFRTSEWKTPTLRAKYYDPVACSIKLSKKISDVYRNHTAIVQAIRDDSNLKVEQKLAKGCCIFGELDHDLARVYDAECPQSTHLVLKIIHVLTEDARSTVCVAPKCHNVLKPYVNSKYKPPQQFIEPVLEIVFGLSSGSDE